MPRPDPKAPRTGQDSLFPDVELTADKRAGEVLRGRHSRAFDDAIRAARSAEVVSDIDGGAATLLRAGGWALDSMERSGHHYGPAKLLPGLSEVLRDLHMTPESRQTDTDAALADLLTELGTLDTDSETDDAAPVSDRAK